MLILPDFPNWQNRDSTSGSDLVLSAGYELEYFSNQRSTVELEGGLFLAII